MKIVFLNVSLPSMNTQQWTYIKLDIATELYEVQCDFVEIQSTSS